MRVPIAAIEARRRGSTSVISAERRVRRAGLAPRQSEDPRDSRVSFEKINNKLPGFSCEWDAARGAAQLYEVFRSIDLDPTTFSGRGHTRLKQLEYLIRTKQLDQQLFWSNP